MLSISKMSGGQEAYYLDLAREDYYLSGGEPPGIWHGTLAGKLGLSGQIEKKQLGALFEGRDPQGGDDLVQKQNWKDRRRVPGWDLTFSAPKSVSTLWAVSDAATRKLIQEVQAVAAEKAFSYLEQNAAFTRRGHGGETLERCELVAGFFEHGTSRAQDPQLHTHVLVCNVGLRQDGTTGALESKPLFEHKMAAGALYRAELAHGLERALGVEMKRVRSWFEIEGVAEAVTEHFSTRRREIERENPANAREAEQAALDTRSVKKHVARDLLFEQWSDQARDLGFTFENAQALFGKVYKRSEIERTLAATLCSQEALERLESDRSFFEKKDLVRYAAQSAQERGVSADLVLEAVERTLSGSGKILELRDEGKTFYTTPELLKLEQETVRLARGSLTDGLHRVSTASLNLGISIVEKELRGKHMDASLSLSDEQKTALAHITTESGSCRCIQGHAGTGKTMLLKAARLAFENEGFKVLGCALSARASQQLENDSGINSRTLRKLLIRLAPSLSYELKHEVKQYARAFQGKSTYKLDKFELTQKTVVVLDEAGMVGTRDMAHLLREVDRAGAKLILVGDTGQIQPIEQGAAFRQIHGEVGYVELTENRRQYESWERDALGLIREGEAQAALADYASKDRLHVFADDELAKTKLVSAWMESRTDSLSDKLILTSTKDDACHVNRLVQRKRQQAGQVELSHGVRVGGETFFVGDRILFTKNDRVLGVNNGSLGTIDAVTRKSITVLLDGQEINARQWTRPTRVTFTTKEYSDILLGYAMTTHKAQGATCEKAFVLGNPVMQDRELSYVQLSRARESTHVFLSEEQAGEDLTAFAQALERSGQKKLIHDLDTRPKQVDEVDRRLITPEAFRK